MKRQLSVFRIRINFLNPLQIKRRRIFFFCTAFFLHKSIGKPKCNGGIQNLVVFVGGNSSVDFWVFAAFIKRCVLTEQAEQIISLWQCVFHPMQQLYGIILASREYHMSDNHTFLQDSMLVIFQAAGLLYHRKNCQRSNFKIIFCL